MKSTKMLRIFGGLSIIFLSFSCKLVESTGLTEESSAGTPTNTPADYSVSSDPNTNPPPPGDSGPTNIPKDPTTIDEGFILEHGAVRTSKTSLFVEMITGRVYAMKVGFTSDCHDGEWEDFMLSKDLSLNGSQLNQSVLVSVQYRDLEGFTSPCYFSSIIQDSAGPDILFQKYPMGTIEEGMTGQLSVKVTDAGSEITKVQCKLNEITRACYGGVNNIDITAMPPGDYTFTVNAEDELGNKSTANVSWKVVSTTRRLAQDIRVDDYKKVDVLFVIDNSGSMQYEQQSMASRTSQFLSILRGLDWQVAVTTTDPRDIALGDGRLIPITGMTNQYVLDSTMPENVAQQALSNTLQRPETGSGSEQGIRANYRLIERWKANEAQPRKFIRTSAQLATVLISDEDESANAVSNDPKALIGLVQSAFGGQKRFSYHSIITRPGDNACRSTYGYTYGERYKIMSDLTGGLIGDVCAMDYAAQVQDIANEIRNLLKTLTLSCEPLKTIPITIKKDGVAFSAPYTLQGVNLKFDSELLPGNYHVDYSCLK